MPGALIFGAGNIGRGFLAQLLYESGREVTFVEVNTELRDAINRENGYTIHIVGPGAEQVKISGVRSIDARDLTAAAQAVSVCEIACTAVGAGALRHIAPLLAAGLELRFRAKSGPLNVIVCENLHDAAGVLRGLVAERLPPECRDRILGQTGFVQAVVSRMVPLQENPPDDPLSIRVEAYKRLPVDGPAVVGKLPPITGVEPVENFAAHVERKLYTHNCAHATLGYLGYLSGWKYGWEPLRDPNIQACLHVVLEQTGKALVTRHGFDPAEQSEHARDLLKRFANRGLGDTCYRLGRDPLRKLAPEDRLVGAIRLCQSTGVEYGALAYVVGCALAFDAAEDPCAMELQRMLREDGLEPTLQNVSGIQPQEELMEMIRVGYKAAIELRDGRER